MQESLKNILDKFDIRRNVAEVKHKHNLWAIYKKLRHSTEWTNILFNELHDVK